MSDFAPETSTEDSSHYDTLEDIPANVFAARRLEASKRRRKVIQVRRAIEADDYENDLKLSVAIDRLLDRLP